MSELNRIVIRLALPTPPVLGETTDLIIGTTRQSMTIVGIVRIGSEPASFGTGHYGEYVYGFEYEITLEPS